MPRIVREAAVLWEGSVARGGGLVTAGTGAFELPFDVPARVRATGAEKTSPEELLAAAHAGCFAMSLGSELARVGARVETVDVRCVVTMDAVEGKGHFIVASDLEAAVRATGVDEHTLEHAARAADEGCPFSALVRASARVGVTTRLTGD